MFNKWIRYRIVENLALDYSMIQNPSSACGWSINSPWSMMNMNRSNSCRNVVLKDIAIFRFATNALDKCHIIIFGLFHYFYLLYDINFQQACAVPHLFSQMKNKNYKWTIMYFARVKVTISRYNQTREIFFYHQF